MIWYYDILRGRVFFQKSGVLEELCFFDPRWKMRREKLLPELALFLGRLPWRRGKSLNMCRKRWLGTENDFNHLVLWHDDHMITISYDHTIIWLYYHIIISSQHQMVEVIFSAKSRFSTHWVVYPLAKEVSPKINALEAITFYDERASDAQTCLAPPKRQFLENKNWPPKFSEIVLVQNVFQRRKMKSCKSSETRFAKVSRRSELCSGGKRPFEISKTF